MNEPKNFQDYVQDHERDWAGRYPEAAKFKTILLTQEQALPDAVPDAAAQQAAA